MAKLFCGFMWCFIPIFIHECALKICEHDSLISHSDFVTPNSTFLRFSFSTPPQNDPCFIALLVGASRTGGCSLTWVENNVVFTIQERESSGLLQQGRDHFTGRYYTWLVFERVIAQKYTRNQRADASRAHRSILSAKRRAEVREICRSHNVCECKYTVWEEAQISAQAGLSVRALLNKD